MKWYGKIAFKKEVEEEPGVFVSQLEEKPYFGDILNLSWREQQGEKINADLHISNKLSIIADQQLQNNFHKIAYITFGDAKWTVSSVEVNYPRLILSLGSLYLEDRNENENRDANIVGGYSWQ